MTKRGNRLNAIYIKESSQTYSYDNRQWFYNILYSLRYYDTLLMYFELLSLYSIALVDYSFTLVYLDVSLALILFDTIKSYNTSIYLYAQVYLKLKIHISNLI